MRSHTHGNRLDCQITYSTHAIIKHITDVARYTGPETLNTIASKAHAIYEHGTPDEVPDRLKGIEIERRRTIVKYKCKTLRVVIAKTIKCLTIVTIFPDPGKRLDIVL